MKAFQDYYPENLAHCYGCGRLNPHGHQIKTFWDGDETVTRFTPLPHHTAVPGFTYGGLIASLVDCHSPRFVSSPGRCMWITSNPRRWPASWSFAGA